MVAAERREYVVIAHSPRFAVIGNSDGKVTAFPRNGDMAIGASPFSNHLATTMQVVPVKANGAVEVPVKTEYGLEVKHLPLNSWAIVLRTVDAYYRVLVRFAYWQSTRTWYVTDKVEEVNLDESLAIYGGYLAYMNMVAAEQNDSED